MNEVVFDRSSLIVYLIKNPNTKARKIASFFGRKPREVNRLLYGNLKLFESNDAYEWSLKQEFQPRNRSSKNPDSQAIQIVAGTCQSEEDTKFHWDPHQKIVIELHGNEYSLIDAGPGCGKTAVACARVAHLIENLDLEPSKILLISFTRTAIKELKERIQLYVEDSTSVAGVQMCTLDSFTWQALFGTSSENREKLFYSFDDNIGEFIQKLKNRDSVILDYLEEFEHVLVDEGQDIVGARSDLILEILNCLNDECGVTIFADGAQAIYGFTMEHGRSVSEESSVLLSKLMNSESEFEKYSKVSLSEVYRTKDKNLVHLFMQGRRILNEIDVNKVDSWKEFKSFIESCAHRSCKSPSEENIVNQSETLVLFRTKAEVLYESMKLWHLNVEHKIRMSGSVPVLAPWIGRIFSTYTYDNIDFNIFKNRWAELIDPKLKAVDDAWSRLLLVVGMNSGKLSLNRLREIIKRDRPPLELIIDESQFNGPVLSTVHSSKGREAKNVYFMLPPDSFIDSDNDDYKRDGYEIAEECRVLFVGATRAREKLLVGKGRQLYAQTLDNGRVFKSVMSGNKKRMVQVGIKGDLDYCSLVNSGNSLDGLKAQENLWAITGAEDVFLQYNLDKKRYELLRAEDDLIALMSTHFGYDLLAVGRQVSKKVTECSGLPQKKIKYLKVTGLTTIVIPEAQRTSLPEPWRHSGIILAPVLTGFPTIYFN